MNLPDASAAFDRAELAGAKVRATCERIGNKLASVSIKECLGRELEPSGGYSIDGVPILVREFPPWKGASLSAGCCSSAASTATSTRL